MGKSTRPTKEEIERIMGNLAGGGFFLKHHARGTVKAERDAFVAANNLLGNLLEHGTIDRLFENSSAYNKEFSYGYVSALVKLKHTDNKELNEICDVAEILLDIVGVDKPVETTRENLFRHIKSFFTKKDAV